MPGSYSIIVGHRQFGGQPRQQLQAAGGLLPGGGGGGGVAVPVGPPVDAVELAPRRVAFELGVGAGGAVARPQHGVADAGVFHRRPVHRSLPFAHINSVADQKHTSFRDDDLGIAADHEDGVLQDGGHLAGGHRALAPARRVHVQEALFCIV